MLTESGPYDIDDVVVLETPVLTLLTEGSIDKDSNQLTVVDAAGYVNGDPVLVEQAGPLNSELEATISGIAGNVLTLSKSASETVTRKRVGKLTTPSSAECKVEKPSGGAAVTVPHTSPRQGWLRALYAVTEAGDHWASFKTTGAAAAYAEIHFGVNERRVA